MRDSNYPLRKAYITALTGLTYNSVAVPVAYQELPNNISPANYIILNSVSSNDVSAKHLSDTSTSIQVTIHTFSDQYNSGKAADDIASLVLQAIYPNRQTHLDLSADNMQCVTTELAGDNTQDYSPQANRKYIDRILTFRHRIFQL